MSIQRTTRDEVFVEYTKSICPVCKVVLDAEVNIRGSKVYLRKRCREHGEFEALVYSDADAYLASAKYNKPGTLPLATQTEVAEGCPSDCGLCPAHKQHACLGIIEVNTNCNLDCPICFADSGHQPDGYSITLEQCATMLDAFVEAEGEPEVVMLSGGEPTIHRDILAFIDLAQERPIRTVTLNTNGIRLATDKAFVSALGERNRTPGKTVSVYLQFDGFDESTHLDLRGKNLLERKRRALDNCAEAGLPVTLVAAVERGLNEHEVGDIVRFGIDHPAVRSVAFQPVTHSGRHREFDPLNRLTNPDVIRMLTEQCPEWFTTADFFPVPCCFPTCRSITYLLVEKTEEGTTVVPIPRLIDLDEYMDYVTNRVLPDPDVRTALEALWSASASMGSDTTSRSLQATAAELECASCGIDLPAAAQDLGETAFMIVVQDFQDPYTLNVKQLMKCCVEEITPDGRLIPFCAYNSVGYREQVRAQMSGVTVADVAPNAAGIQSLLTYTPYGSKTAADGGAYPQDTVPGTGRTIPAGQTNLGMPVVRR
ncbi:radical SAM protein [Sinomonas terrae]|uniref:Radical SAM protein n=1 Tax=Sinomonas terrae TaxID=2908838 RepID=A0ABS9U3E0_9MICC|nr:radical SAM protein [Sinomonas terrae]MCH6471209.1 radical SAM protein [Sinomonas terrae]